MVCIKDLNKEGFNQTALNGFEQQKQLHEKNHVIHTILHIFWSATTMYLLICPLFIKIFEASHWPSDHLISTKMGLPDKASHSAKNVFSRTGIKICSLVCTNMRLVQKL